MGRRGGSPPSPRGRRSSAASTPSANAVTSSAAAEAAAAIGIDRRREPGEQMTPTHDDVVLPLPPNAPRVKPNVFTRWLVGSVVGVVVGGCAGGRACGAGGVVIVARQVCHWGGLWVGVVKMAVGVCIRVLGKVSLFRLPVVWLCLGGQSKR